MSILEAGNGAKVVHWYLGESATAEEGDQSRALPLLTALPGKAHLLRWGQRTEFQETPVLGPDWAGGWWPARGHHRFLQGLARPEVTQCFSQDFSQEAGMRVADFVFSLGWDCRPWQEVHRKASAELPLCL